jgi:predicted  nucleic acid-binding Zn-ribbon protein
LTFQAIENELDKAQEDLSAANQLLEEKEKKVQEVGLEPRAFPSYV